MKEGIQKSPDAMREKWERVGDAMERWSGAQVHIHSSEFSHPESHDEPEYSAQEIQDYATEIGMETVGFSPHVTNPGAPERLAGDDKRMRELFNYIEHIHALNEKNPESAKALAGAEVAIVYDEETGTFAPELSDEALSELDYWIGSRHGITREGGEWAGDIEKDPAMIVASIRKNIASGADVIGHIDRYAWMDSSWYQNEFMPKFGDCVFGQDAQRKRKTRKTFDSFMEKYGDSDLTTRANGKSFRERWQSYDDYVADMKQMWETVLDDMVENDVALEVNVNSPVSKTLIRQAAKKGIRFTLNFDMHDAGQLGKDRAEASLAKGPGFRAIRRIVEWDKTILDAMGVSEDPNERTVEEKEILKERTLGSGSAFVRFIQKRREK